MASQDETPTHQPTAGGEPEAGASAPAETGAGSGATARTDGPLGRDEHADWDAAFNGLGGHPETVRADDAAPAENTADAATAPNAGTTTGGSDAGKQGTGDTAGSDLQDAGTPDAGATATGDARPADATDAARPDTETAGTELPGTDRESAGTGSTTPGSTGTDDTAPTVPGGHPSVAQRSELPMRRASTLPDLSRFESEAPDGAQRVSDGDGTGERAAGEGATASGPGTADTHAADNKGAETSAAPATQLLGTAGGRTNGGRTIDGATNDGAGQDAGTGHASAGSTADKYASGASAAAGAAAATAAGATVHGAHQETASGKAAAGKGTTERADNGSSEPGTTGTANGTAGSKTGTNGTGTGDSNIADRDSEDLDTEDRDTRDRDTRDRGAEDSGTAADDALSPAEAERRAREREKAAAGKPVLARVLQVMIAVFFPVMVLAAAIRAVATPLFLWAEYHRPGFPADTFGFSTDDRMTYGSYAVDYLLNFSSPRYLADLVGDGGEPLYLASEVSHMADVKTVLTVAFVTATAMAVLSILGALYLARRSPGGIRRSLFAGALVTLVLVAVLLVLAVLGWEQFFTQLHTIFFANGNWTFRLDDTLIRLFPAQFWMDAGIVIAALVLLTCAVVIASCWPTKARRERVRLAREDARRRYTESLEAL